MAHEILEMRLDVDWRSSSMMTQDTLFDHARNERNGILDALAASRLSYLAGMRSIAREIAGRTGRVTVDDVSTAAKERGYPMPEDCGYDRRCLGALFRSAEFEAIGRELTTRSARIARSGAGSSYIVVYRLRGAR